MIFIRPLNDVILTLSIEELTEKDYEPTKARIDEISKEGLRETVPEYVSQALWSNQHDCLEVINTYLEGKNKGGSNARNWTWNLLYAIVDGEIEARCKFLC